jgi:hypothetical protein
MDWNHSRPDPPSTGTSGGFAAILNVLIEALDVLMQGVRRAGHDAIAGVDGIDGIDAIAGTGCFDESKLALT